MTKSQVKVKVNVIIVRSLIQYVKCIISHCLSLIMQTQIVFASIVLMSSKCLTNIEFTF